MAPELDRVEVRLVADPVDEDELVLEPVIAPLPAFDLFQKQRVRSTLWTPSLSAEKPVIVTSMLASRTASSASQR